MIARSALPLHIESTIHQANNASAPLPRAARACLSLPPRSIQPLARKQTLPNKSVIQQADGALAPLPRAARACLSGGGWSRESRKFFLGPAWLRRASFTSVISCGSESLWFNSPCRAMLAGPRKTLERALGTPAGARHLLAVPKKARSLPSGRPPSVVSSPPPHSIAHLIASVAPCARALQSHLCTSPRWRRRTR